jgi:hypothetical protein
MLSFAIPVLLLVAIIFQGYQRYVRIKSSLPPPLPADRGVRVSWAIPRDGEWWKLPTTLLTVLIAGFILWQNVEVIHQSFKSVLPPVIAGVLALSAILSWFKRDEPTKRG